MSDESKDWTARFLAESREREAEDDAYLAEVAARAHAAGKEPFDLDSFEALYDTSSDLAEGHVTPREAREREWRWVYYVNFPDVMTVRELAERLEETAPYRDA